MPFTDDRISGLLDRAARQGADRAATALTSFTGRSIQFTHRETRLLMRVDGEELLNGSSTSDRVLVGAMDIDGGRFAGRGFVLMGSSAVEGLLTIFALDTDASGLPDDMATSMLAEFTNITMSSYLNALSDALSMAVDPSPTGLQWMSAPISEVDRATFQSSDPAIVLHCECSAESTVNELSIMIMINQADVAALVGSEQVGADNVSSTSHEG